MPPDLELPVERGCPFAAPAGYARLREQAPINRAHLVTGPEVWVVSGHEESRAVLADRRFSANRGDENFPLVDSDPAARQRFRDQPPVMLSMDGEQHAATRRVVLGEFTMKRLNALEPRIQAIVDGFIDDILATGQRPVDLVQALSLPVPSLVICELLGAPYTTMTSSRAAPPRRSAGACPQRSGRDRTLDHASLVSMALLLASVRTWPGWSCASSSTRCSAASGLRLAKPVDDLAFKTDAGLYGAYELPVTW